jgi:hypothetical protein
MVSENEAVSAATTKINSDYGLIKDLAQAVSSTAPINQELGGITISGSASEPGTMLAVSTAMSNAQTTDGQIVDAVMKLQGSKKAVAQKIG